jgi:hypothetical protein
MNVIICHRRYYKDGSELTLDVGPFMKAMEVSFWLVIVNLNCLAVIIIITLSYYTFNIMQYATGLTANVIGKPSAAFFTSALKELGVEPQNVL